MSNKKHTCEEMEDAYESSKKRVKKHSTNEKRKRPNILVTGTPGTGKSTLCESLKNSIENVNVINVGQFAKENGCLGDWDEKYECHELDEDKVLDELEEILSKGNCIIDYHMTDIFPERWFDAVFVLRTETSKLYGRLENRKYNDKKLQDNVQCEIFQTILDEAKDSYKPEIVHELQSNNLEDVQENAKNICLWIDQWIKDNSDS